MSKLPTDFVKAPAAQPKPRARRARKASLISPEPVVDPRQILLHLTDDEHQALEEARAVLNQAGADVTLEQMIHRVFADWMVRIRTVVAPPAAPAEPEPAPVHDDGLRARLRDFVAAPLKTWRALARQLWRESVATSRWLRAR